MPRNDTEKTASRRPHYTAAERRRWMRTLAGSAPEHLVECYRALRPRPDYELVDRRLVPPLEARQPGRVKLLVSPWMTRCVIRLANGTTGMACLRGTRKRHAELAAVFDALLKQPGYYDELIDTLTETVEYGVGRSLIEIDPRAYAALST